MDTFSLLTACVLVFGQAGSLTESSKPAADGEKSQQPAPILIDWIHANDFSMVGLRPGVYDYHATCGSRHGFEYLALRGYPQDYAYLGRLTPERLAPHKLLVINLVSAEREPFLVSEIMAIRSYVDCGGSLFLVTEHSNAYFHSHRLKPLLSMLGIASSTDTACEAPPLTLGRGCGWLAVTHFIDHPVTAGLRRIAMLSGGTVDRRYAVALTSDKSWADEWRAGVYGEDNASGFCGNFRRDESEPLGPHGVVLAREYGRGRIVIVADQNMISDNLINYADNYRLWLNAMSWLLRDPALADCSGYESWHSPRIVAYEPPEKPAFGCGDEDGYFNAMSLLARHHWLLVNDRFSVPANLRIFADDRCALSAEQRRSLLEELSSGQTLLVLSPESPPGQAGADSLADLFRGPDFPGTVRRETPEEVIRELPGGGAVRWLKAEWLVDNEHLDPPSQVPRAEQRRRAEWFLAKIQAILDRGKKASAPDD